jgi:hypothetical protein
MKFEDASAGNDREISKTARRKMTLICCAIRRPVHPLASPAWQKSRVGSVRRKLSEEAQSSAAKVVECSFCSSAVEMRTKG